MASHPDSQKQLGIAVRKMRVEAGMSQEELAAQAGLEPSLIARVEAGEADPTWGDARRIATALGTTVDRLAALVEELEADER